MRKDDKPKFAATMNGIAKVYEREIDSALLEAYWLALRSWTLEEFEIAAARLMASSKFMPRPYDFDQLRKAALPTAGEAWARAVKYAASSAYRSGQEGEIPIGDPIIDLCVRALGGYRAIGMTNTDELHFLERRFTEHYEAKQDADGIREAIPSIGRSFAENSGLLERMDITPRGRRLE